MTEEAAAARRADGVWPLLTTWSSIAITMAAAVLLLVRSHDPDVAISEVDFSGFSISVVRLAAGVLMGVLALSCLVQAALYLPQRSSKRPGLPAPAVLDLALIVVVAVETPLVLSVGPRAELSLHVVIVAGGIVLASIAIVRFLVVVLAGLGEIADRRRERRPS